MTDQNNYRNLLIHGISNEAKLDFFNAANLVHIDLKEEIYALNSVVKYVDFPERGVMSVVTPMDDGTFVEIATVGNEGMLGVGILHGVSFVGDTTFCQVEGASWRVTTSDFQDLLTKHPDLVAICQRYTMTYLDQVGRNVGCNRTHSVDSRCARWLLQTQDRCGTDVVALTQEFLAMMLGVSRTGVNGAGGRLTAAGFIKYTRGKITIINRKGLEEYCCACYLTTRSYYNRVMDIKDKMPV